MQSEVFVKPPLSRLSSFDFHGDFFFFLVFPFMIPLVFFNSFCPLSFLSFCFPSLCMHRRLIWLSILWLGCLKRSFLSWTTRPRFFTALEIKLFSDFEASFRSAPNAPPPFLLAYVERDHFKSTSFPLFFYLFSCLFWPIVWVFPYISSEIWLTFLLCCAFLPPGDVRK